MREASRGSLGWWFRDRGRRRNRALASGRTNRLRVESLEHRYLLSGLENVASPIVPIATDNQYLTLEDAPVMRNMVTDDTGHGTDTGGSGSPPLVVTEIDGQSYLPGQMISLVSGATLTVDPGGEFVYDPTTSPTLGAIDTGAPAQHDSFQYLVGTGYTDVVVFGDSLSDIGNLYAISGSTFPPDPPYWQGRVSNGPVWVEQLAERLNLQSTTENNYAVAGAMTGDGNFNERPDRLNTDLPGLADEITQFVGSLSGGLADPDALYVVWAGANNFFDPANLTPEQAGQAITETIAAVATLRYYGAEHILLGNLPDLGLTPNGRGSGMGYLLTGFSMQYNQALQAALTTYGLDVIYFDSFTSFNEVVNNPSVYGLSNVTSACFDGTQICGNPDEYLFWDGVHPTTKGHQVLAEIVFQQLVSLAPLNNADSATVDIAVSDVSTPVAFVNDHLYVGGTNQNDRILVMPQRFGGVYVNVNGSRLGPYQLEPDARIVAFAHDGNDFLWAGAASRAVILDGGAGNDLMFGGWAGDILRGDTGNDLLFGGHGADTLLGNSGRDVLFGGSGDDLLCGGSDDDRLFGGRGDDTLLGEAGNDFLFGGIGEDELDGGDGFDWLFGEPGLDRLVDGVWEFLR